MTAIHWRLRPPHRPDFLQSHQGRSNIWAMTFYDFLHSSPRSWGCFLVRVLRPVLALLLPTFVGVFLFPAFELALGHPPPHVRGGVSLLVQVSVVRSHSSPRSWGCFDILSAAGKQGILLPTFVGVFPTGLGHGDESDAPPHVRGGVSFLYKFAWRGSNSSPRSWGCFQMSTLSKFLQVLLPTFVGVFLDAAAVAAADHPPPHVRGGVSASQDGTHADIASSPRSWGVSCPSRFRRVA